MVRGIAGASSSRTVPRRPRPCFRELSSMVDNSSSCVEVADGSCLILRETDVLGSIDSSSVCEATDGLRVGPRADTEALRTLAPRPRPRPRPRPPLVELSLVDLVAESVLSCAIVLSFATGVASCSGVSSLALIGLTSRDTGLFGESGGFTPLPRSTCFHLVDEADVLTDKGGPGRFLPSDAGVCCPIYREGCCWV